MSHAKPQCISGTWHNDGQAIHEHIRREQAKAILAAPSQIRRKRTPSQWKAMYKAAMAEKKRCGLFSDDANQIDLIEMLMDPLDC